MATPDFHTRNRKPPPRNRQKKPKQQRQGNGAAPPLAPDRAETERFLALLDPAVDGFTFQTFDDDAVRKKANYQKRRETNARRKAKGLPPLKGNPDPFAHVFNGTLSKYWNELCRLNAQRVGIFVTVNRTDGKGRKTENVTEVRALFNDLDGAPLEPVMQSKTPPQIVVASSPGKYHAYRRVTGITLKQFKPLQQALATQFGGDPSVHDLSRVLRLPGFLHQKDKPFLTHIISTSKVPAYTAADFQVAQQNGTEEGAAEDAYVAHGEESRSPAQQLNDAALANLKAWVPELFPSATPYQGDGFRVTSADLGRELEEDISFHRDGIKDFGVHDLDDPLEGKRTPIDIVMEHKLGVSIEEIAERTSTEEYQEACAWLRERLGLNEEKKEKPSAIEMVCAADVKMRPKEWLWEGHLARGALQLMTGQPGLGKSQLQIHFMACVTARLRWPDGAPAVEPMKVIMVTAEDAIDTDVVPRLSAAGADLKRIHILKYIKTDKHKRQFLLAEDLTKLEQAIAQVGNVGLVCIDPITAYMGGKTDAHKSTEVRSQLGPLKDFSDRTNVAVSAITHPAKNAGARAIDHFIASQAFIAAARIGHACFEELEENEEGEKAPTGRYLFTHVKHSGSKKMPTLAYKIEVVMLQPEPFVQIETTRIVWEKGAVNISADQAVAFARSSKKAKEEEQAASELMDCVRGMVDAGGGWCKQTDIAAQAKALGYSEKELRTVRKRLALTAKRKGGAGKEGWWELGWEGKRPIRFS